MLVYFVKAYEIFWSLVTAINVYGYAMNLHGIAFYRKSDSPIAQDNDSVTKKGGSGEKT